MLRTAVVIDERYEDHETGHGHPERAERVAALRDLVESLGDAGLIRDEVAKYGEVVEMSIEEPSFRP